jgi:hypothetical protein
VLQCVPLTTSVFSVGRFSLDLLTAAIQYGFFMHLKMRGFPICVGSYFSNRVLAGESHRALT